MGWRCRLDQLELIVCGRGLAWELLIWRHNRITIRLAWSCRLDRVWRLDSAIVSTQFSGVKTFVGSRRPTITLTQPCASILFVFQSFQVYLGCWNSSEEIVSYMESKTYDTTVDGFIKLWSEFHEKALDIWDEELTALGYEDKQPVMLWSSELTQAHRIQKHLDKDR